MEDGLSSVSSAALAASACGESRKRRGWYGLPSCVTGSMQMTIGELVKPRGHFELGFHQSFYIPCCTSPFLKSLWKVPSALPRLIKNAVGSPFGGARGQPSPMTPEYVAVLLLSSTVNPFADATTIPYPIPSPVIMLSVTVPECTIESVSSDQVDGPMFMPTLRYDPRPEIVL